MLNSIFAGRAERLRRRFTFYSQSSPVNSTLPLPESRGYSLCGEASFTFSGNGGCISARAIGAIMALRPMSKPSSAEFRRTMSRFATGVTVITVAQPDGEPKGMTANAFASVSLDPPLVLVCVDWRARTHNLLRDAEHFAVSVLDEHQEAIAEFFAMPNGHPENMARLGIRFRRSANGTPFLEGCLAHLICRRVGAHRAGDHTIYVGQAEHLSARDGRPLLFYGGGYRGLAGSAG